MRDILKDVVSLRRNGSPIALGTVIATWGSSPRGPGSRIAVTADGEIAGSVSGGCVENAVVEAGMAALNSNRPQLLHFSVSDETAWQVGLACGGSIEVFVNPLNMDMFQEVCSALTDPDPVVLITAVRGSEGILGRELLVRHGGQVAGTIGTEWDEAAIRLARETPEEAIPRCHLLGRGVEVFVEFISPPITLIVIGGVHVALPLISMARLQGFSTILIDPRATWGNSARFADVDQWIGDWPEEAFQQIEVTQRTAIVALTHEPRLDDPALRIALQGPAFYVGALGSRRTQSGRRERLLAAGLTDEQVSRLHAPIGLDIGAETPEEIALAILAEVVATLHKPDKHKASMWATQAATIEAMAPMTGQASI